MADSGSSPLKSESKYSDPSLQGEKYLEFNFSGLEKKKHKEVASSASENLVQDLLLQFFSSPLKLNSKYSSPRKLGSEYLDSDFSGLEPESAKSSSLFSRT